MSGTILVVDDEPAIGIAVQHVLEACGHSADVVRSADAAMAALERHPYDVIVSDLDLGRVTGMDILRWVRAHAPRTEVIMITGHGSERAAVEAMKLGAADYLPKPFDNDELERMVAHALEHRTSDTPADAYRQLQSTQRELLQHEKMACIGQLVAGVAHEINNPVSVVMGNLAPLRARLRALRAAAVRHDDSDLLRLIDRVLTIVETIGRGAARMAGVVDDLRSFSRLGDDARMACDVRGSVEAALRLLAAKWGQRITVDRTYDELPTVHAVARQLNELFLHLLTNAGDAIAGDGTVRIRADWDGETALCVEIADDGIGMPDEVLDHVFDPFFTTKAQGAGVGLGLTISQRIATDHGGRIDVRSALGRGTTVTVRLPVSGGPAARAGAS